MRPGIPDPVQPQAWYRCQSLEHGERQLSLARMDGRHRAAQPAAPVGSVGHLAVGGAERLEVAERSEQAGKRLVVLGADLQLAGELRTGRPDPIRGQLLEQVAAAVEHAEMGAEVLVRAGDQQVGAQRRDVDRQVRCGVHGIDVDRGAHRMRRLDDPTDVGHRAERVRREPDRHDPGARREDVVERIQVERRADPPPAPASGRSPRDPRQRRATARRWRRGRAASRPPRRRVADRDRARG